MECSSPSSLVAAPGARHPADFTVAEVCGLPCVVRVPLVARAHPLRGQSEGQKASDQRTCAEHAKSPAVEALAASPSPRGITGSIAVTMLLDRFTGCMNERGYDVEEPSEYSARPSNP